MQKALKQIASVADVHNMSDEDDEGEGVFAGGW